MYAGDTCFDFLGFRYLRSNFTYIHHADINITNGNHLKLLPIMPYLTLRDGADDPIITSTAHPLPASVPKLRHNPAGFIYAAIALSIAVVLYPIG
jgi:hypothetical protein